MNQTLRQPYEISLWQDVLINEDDKSYYREEKLVTIGSDTMIAPGRAHSPKLTKNMNGEINFSFEMAYSYYNEVTGKIEDNPLIPLLVNERKVKLFFLDEWYDFIIKEVNRSSDSNVVTCDCVSLFVNELGKTGYNIVLSNDLANNQGNIFELAEKAVDGSDWVIDVDNSDIIQQLVSEPVYVYKAAGVVDVLNVDTEEQETVEVDEIIYVFYSEVANSQKENVQFLRLKDIEEGKAQVDDNNTYTCTNYRFLDYVEYKTDLIAVSGINFNLQTDRDDTTSTGILVGHQGNRLIYNQKVVYDPIKQRTVSLYKTPDRGGAETTVYKYTDYEYLTSESVTNYVENGSGFNVFSDGSLEGWSNATQTEATGNEIVLQPMDLVTRPEVVPTSLINLSSVSSIQGFLRIKFKGVLNNYKNIIFNEGFENYRDTIDSLSRGEKYVFRIRCGIGNETGQITPYNYEDGKGIKAIVAKYDIKSVNYKASTDDTEGTTGFIYTIDPNNILFKFDGSYKMKIGETIAPVGFKEKNNVITGGYFREDKKVYYKDDIAITPTLDYVYVGPIGRETESSSNDFNGVWDSVNNTYKALDDSFMNYYYTVAECTQSISNTDLEAATTNIGIFLYTDKINDQPYYYINNVEIFKYKEDGNNEPTLIGNVPKSTAYETDYYYLKPVKSATAEDIETYSTIEALANSLGFTADEIVPDYNEKHEKISSIEASKSNSFNILQDLAEAFECWVKFHIDHNEDGSIKLDREGAPFKRITFHTFGGKNNFAGFKYAINLNSIERTIDSNELVSKLIVEQVENDNVDGGLVTIASAPSNPTKESYILNFNHYISKGLVDDVAAFYIDKANFDKDLSDINSEYTTLKNLLTLYTISRIGVNKNRNVYQTLVKDAKIDFTEAQEEFKELTGVSYDDYLQQNGLTINITRNGNNFTAVYNSALFDIDFTFYDGSNQTMEPTNETEDATTFIKTYSFNSAPTTIGIEGTATNYRYVDPKNTTSTSTIDNLKWNINQLISDGGKLVFVPSDDNESFVEIVGRLVTDQSVINQYSSLLEVSREEKANLDIAIDGTKNHVITIETVSKTEEGTTFNSTRETIDDYIEGLKFTLSSSTSIYSIESSITEKIFSQDQLFTQITFTQYPPNYRLRWTTIGENKEIYSHYADGAKTFALNPNEIVSFTLVPIEEKVGFVDRLDEILEEKKEREKEFYKKYSRFIQEGTWTSQDYVDNELYYLDALNVSNTNAKPKVSYNLTVSEISELKGYENYYFDVGDKTTIEDPQFFGYESLDVIEDRILYELTPELLVIQMPETTIEVTNVRTHTGERTPENTNGATVGFNFNYFTKELTLTKGVPEVGTELRIDFRFKVKTPYKEEVIVSEASWELDEPENNSITIQNYRTQFEDLFQRIAATVQSVEYNSPSFARAASILDTGGLINPSLLANSLSGMSSFVLPGNILIDEFGVTTKNYKEPARQMRITGDALQVTTDEGYNWDNVITAEGINTNKLTAGNIDTQQIQIIDGENTSFRWDQYGLNAYGYGQPSGAYDLKTYVRFDKYGLYGVKDGETFQASSIDDIKKVAHFGVTWDGFFIKNSYTDGYVSITSDEDFQVMVKDPNSEDAYNERIKIGALEQTEDGYKYGIRINNNEGNNVFVTDDNGDITMTGVINAKGGTFTDEIKVGSSDNSIVLKGSENDAVIGSSQYFDDASKGWAIKSDGDAIFNNITARGAIKTAVFEYSEIEAVGGIFIFRPSSTIRSAEIPTTVTLNYKKVVPEGESSESYEINPDIDYFTKDGDVYTLVEEPNIEDIDLYYFLTGDDTVVYSNDLLITVENPLLFSIGDWCKVSNFDSATPETALNSGLINVFEISNISNSVLTLDGGAQMFKDIIDAEPEEPETVIVSREDIDSPFVMTTSEGSDFEKISQKYIYDFYYEIESATEGLDTTTVAIGAPSDLTIVDGQITTTIKYIGNIYLWNQEQEDTGEDFLLIQLNNKTYLYVNENNSLYGEVGEKELTLVKQINVTNQIDSLTGGALISFANYPYSSVSVGKVDVGTVDKAIVGQEALELKNNYGIGINSSDSAVNLPPRAITLFESNILPEASTGIKVEYNIRGLVGTLPETKVLNTGKGLPSGKDAVADLYTENMEGLQGIYTDNMYIGDADQYLAYYTKADYEKVANPTGSPAAQGYFEKVDGEYVSSEDIIVNPDKTYYQYNEKAKHLDIVGSSINLAMDDGDRIIQIINANSSDGVQISGDKLNLTELLTIGNPKGIHISVTEKEIGFWSAEEKDKETGDPLPENKTAYIDSQKLYIPYSVVLNEMEIGTEENEAGQETPLWAWKKTSNRGLSLVWLGGDE